MLKIPKNYEFNKDEISFIRSLNTPTKIQQFVESVEYNKGKRISVIDVLRKKKGDCLEVACFASLVFSMHGFKNFIVDLKAEKDDDHIICVFKINGLYGAVAQSKYLGLRYKNPVYKNLRELVMSYFEHYFNYFGVLDLKQYSDEYYISLRWNDLCCVKKMCFYEEDIDAIKHFRVVPKNIKLPKVSPDVFEREAIMMYDNLRVGKEYQECYMRIKKI